MSNMGLTKVAHYDSEKDAPAHPRLTKKKTKQSNDSETGKEKMETFNRFDTLSRLIYDESQDRLSIEDKTKIV